MHRKFHVRVREERKEEEKAFGVEEEHASSFVASLNSNRVAGPFSLSEIHYVSYVAIIVHHHVVLPFTRPKHFMTC